MTTDCDVDPRGENGYNEDAPECPLCMEALDLDDINFYPCPCNYQVCKFCWHRIKTDDSGLCPACRQKYPDDPVEFKPVPNDEAQKFKTKKRVGQKKKDTKEKGDRVIEARKALATLRVVQKNLVFVIGLAPKLTDTDTLKKSEYFGRFGKIIKVMVNTLNANGTPASSASAYITYQRVDDALRAVKALNGFHIEGRVLKVSLGTTKYCVNFLKNLPCSKPECMYLHDYGDSEASFTKEEMQAGKHQEYERRLLEALSTPTSGPSSAPVDITISRQAKISLSESESPIGSELRKNDSSSGSIPREPSPATSSVSSSNSGSLNEQPSERGSPNVAFDLFVDTFEDFGFDPWNESAKGLAALMELERAQEPQSPFSPSSYHQAAHTGRSVLYTAHDPFLNPSIAAFQHQRRFDYFEAMKMQQQQQRPEWQFENAAHYNHMRGVQNGIGHAAVGSVDRFQMGAGIVGQGMGAMNYRMSRLNM